jgi:hypothetical protein
VSLIRSDDVKLACSTMQKPLPKSSKVITDLDKREQERIFKEDEILKELTLVQQKTFQIVETSTRKMVKKMLNLVLAEHSQLFLQGPSHLQLACVMGERTADEKASFGKVKAGESDGKPAFELTE